MLSLILGFVTGLAGPITSVVGKLLDLKTARENAKTDIQKAKIDSEIEETHDKKAVLVAEAGSRIGAAINAGMRAMAAIPAIAFLAKVLLWDKVIGAFKGCAGSGTGDLLQCLTFKTDSIEPNMWWVIIAVIGFYFVTSRKT